MQRSKISIAKKTLKFLEENSWSKIQLSKIINKKENDFIKNNNELLINLNKYFDFLLKENLASIEKSSTKDMLFEVIMARLDIINNHRKSIKKLLNYFISRPHELIYFIPTFIESIILIATLSNIDITGIKGIPKVKLILILYLLITYTWMKDETESLEKTMTTLDNYLNYIDKFLNWF